MLSVNNYPNNNLKVQNPSFRRYDGYASSTSSTTKKVAVGAASLLIPGLGQVINGETSKGVALFLANLCNYLLCLKNRNHMIIGTIDAVGIRGYAVYDAYKKA